jgi:hypothetical protein
MLGTGRESGLGRSPLRSVAIRSRARAAQFGKASSRSKDHREDDLPGW